MKTMKISCDCSTSNLSSSQNTPSSSWSKWEKGQDKSTLWYIWKRRLQLMTLKLSQGWVITLSSFILVIWPPLRSIARMKKASILSIRKEIRLKSTTISAKMSNSKPKYEGSAILYKSYQLKTKKTLMLNKNISMKSKTHPRLHTDLNLADFMLKKSYNSLWFIIWLLANQMLKSHQLLAFSWSHSLVFG